MIVPDLALIGQGSQTSSLNAGLVIAANVVTIVAALYGFFRYAERQAESRFKRLVNELVMPTLKKHVKKDDKQFKATNRVLKELRKVVVQHSDQIEALESAHSARAGP